MIARIADLTWKRPKLVLALVGVFVAVAVGIARNVEDHLQAAGFTDPDSESERATELLREELGYDANPGIYLLVRGPDGGRLDVASPAVRQEVARLTRELRRTPHVGRVVNPLTAGPQGRRLVEPDGRSLVISGHLTTQDVENDGGDAAAHLRPRLEGSRLDVGMGGFAPAFDEVNDQTRDDLIKAEAIAFPILAVLLLLVFRGVIAAAIPLAIGGISILGAFLFLRFMSEFVDTSLFALNIATALSLGLAVDYALLLVSRYREEIERDGPTREAHRRTMLTAGRTVAFSALTVAAAMAALMVLPQRFLYSMGAAGAVVGLLAGLIALLVVGSLLSLLGNRINALAIRRGPSVSEASGAWYRLAWGVMRRPFAVALGSSAVLLAAATPMLWTTLTGPSAEAVAPGLPSHAPNEYVERNYSRDISEAITVTVRGDVPRGELAAYSREISRIDGIGDAAPFQRANGDTAFANFAGEGPALSGPVQDAVREIRNTGPPGGSELYVSGNTARFVDQKRSIADHAPLVGGLVIGATLVILFLLTGSVLLPIKTLVMNALTLASTVGILVLAFQEGWLGGPLDYTGPAAIELNSLVLLFAVTFGLATDYAVLVMARIKEQHDLGASNEEAVAIGIGRTGRVVSAAAIMIAVVFFAFAVSSIFFMKELAIGQGIGVIIDATIVRALLVPSLMRLFGEWNWKAPAPLRRFHARFGFSEA